MYCGRERDNTFAFRRIFIFMCECVEREILLKELNAKMEKMEKFLELFL